MYKSFLKFGGSMKSIFGFLCLWVVFLNANPVIDQALEDLNSYAGVQKSCKTQDPSLAYGMRKALVMADLMVDAEGKLNLSWRPDIKAAFISPEQEDYEVEMVRFLDQIDSWQPFFDSISTPANSFLLQGQFGALMITDRHAKVAVLAAMLAPYNQGSVGDCFAVNDLIRDHEEYYRHTAEDFKSIVMNGYVERPVNGSVDRFYFLPLLADGDRDQEITLSFPLFHAPGFAAARNVMGASDCPHFEALVQKALEGQEPITPSKVIAAMAQVVNHNVQELIVKGNYAFSCLTNNPVLRACEAAYAAMAEDRTSDSMRSNINDALTQALKTVFPDPKLEQKLVDAFNQSYRLVYNLDIPLPQPSDDGSSTDGGFQLYQRCPDGMGTRIESPEDFRSLVLNALANAMIDQKTVTDFVHTEEFLKEVLWDYDDANKKESDPVHNYQKLSRTPMQCCDGDNNYEVDDIETQTTYDNDVQTCTPTSTQDLMVWCLNLACKAPSELCPMDTPQHAFNFAPANPDLKAYVASKTAPAQWLQKKLVVPGMQVSTKAMNPKVEPLILKALIDGGVTDSPDLQKLAGDLASQTLSVQTYAQKLLAGLNTILSPTSNQAQELALLLDQALIQSLPVNDQTLLQNSAIRFAFTNWNEGTKDIYFCAFFNPRTQKIAFGTMLEDKTELSPMDETQWVVQQQWDVDLRPNAPKTLLMR